MRIKLTYILSCLLLFAFGCRVNNSAKDDEVQEDGRPNIIIILADDLGYSDLSCYGGEIETPNLDRLAYSGVRLTSFYNTSRCCPTRASLLTGLYPHQAGIGRMTMDMGLPGYRGTLGQNTVTIAEVLKASGYQTAMTGKWHVSPTERLEREEQLKWLAHQKSFGPFSDTLTYPTNRGFDKYFGNIWGVVDYYDPFSLVNGTDEVLNVPKDFYYTDAIGDTTVTYIKQFSKEKSPFFLYVAHCAPHWPLHAPEESVEKYEDIYSKGWKSIRDARYQGLIEKSIIDSSVQLPEFMFPKKDWDNNEDKDWDAKAMAVHAAMVDRMDQSLGKIIGALEETGELENTLILFFSDNGASSERPSKYGPGFDRPGSTRDGREVAFPVDKDKMPGPQTVHSGIGPVWAHTINAPYRFWKARTYEGGINSPFIAHWPKGNLNEGAVLNSAAHVVDIMATCLELAEAEYPKEFEGRQITPLVGKSMLPIIYGESQQPTHDTFFWEHFGSAALRKSNYKLVRQNADSLWELYDLSVDRTETKNIAASNMELVDSLANEWMDLAHELKVYPAPENN